MKKCAVLLAAAGIINLLTPVYAEDAQIVEKGIVENYDFQEYDPQSFSETGNYLDGKIWIRNFRSGDSVEIAEEEDGNRALKITAKKENLKSGSDSVIFVFDKAYTTKIKVNFDLKIESDNGGCASFCGFGSSNDQAGFNTEVNNRIWSNYWWCQNSGTTNWGNIPTHLMYGWFPVEMTIDLENGKFSGNTYRQYGTPAQSFQKREWDFSKDMVGDIKYMCLASIGTANVNASPEKDTVYWFDNIRVTSYGYPEMSAKIVQDGEVLSEDAPVKIEFSEAVSDEALVSDYFELKKDGEIIDALSITADEQNKVVSVIPSGGWEYGAKYLLSVKKEIPSMLDKVIPMREDLTANIEIESIIGELNISEGDRFNAMVKPAHSELEGVSYRAELKKGSAEYEAYDFGTIDEVGEYTIKITAEKNGKTQIAEIHFTVIGKVQPEAHDVKIVGKSEKGAVLKGEYTFFDENGDDEGESKFRWLISDMKDGTYEPLKKQDSEPEDGIEITLDERVADKYIKFEVTPISKEEPYEGKAFLSEAKCGLFAPVISEAIIEKNGNILSAGYKYFDENEEDEEDSVLFQWYRRDKKDGDGTKIDGAETDTYELTEKDDNKFITVEITPKSKAYPYLGKGVFADPAASEFAPIATDLKFIGDTAAGQTVGAEYTYYDENSDAEGDTKIKWYINGNCVRDGKSYTIEQSDAGKTIYFTVTPYQADGKGGKTYESGKRTVSGTKKNHTSGGSSGGSSGGTSGGTNKTPTVSPGTDKPESKPDDTEKEIFADIANHWAKDDITELYKKGIINGINENEFCPDGHLTRAQAAAILQRSLDLPEGECDFSDVDKNAWYYSAIAAASTNGLVFGNDGYFRPNDEITREELCVIIARALKGDDESFEQITFADEEEISAWAVDGVKFLYSKGLVTGMENNLFKPKAKTTRAQAAVIINRLLKIMGGSENE